MAESQTPDTTEVLRALFRDFRDTAREYKRLSGLYRRKAREVMEKLSQLQRHYAAMGIRLEYDISIEEDSELCRTQTT
jgi:hypothetical protein